MLNRILYADDILLISHSISEYYAVLDTAVNCIEERIKQPGLQLYVSIEQLLLDAANGQVTDERLSSVCDFFREDIDRERLRTQLLVLPELCKRQSVTKVGELKSHLVDLGLSAYMFSEVQTLLKLFYVIPGSSATAERSFSVMRRIKNYLRTTMTSQRLNSVMLLHVHRELADALDMNILVNDFVTGSSNRKEIFG